MLLVLLFGAVSAAPLVAFKTVVDLAVATPDLSTLVAALKAGALVDTLSGQGPFTVFAPTNKAFAELPNDFLAALLEPKNKEFLDKILTYHVVAGDIHIKDLKEGMQSFKSLEGTDVEVFRSNLPGGPHATFLACKMCYSTGHYIEMLPVDLDASNGVVQIINQVLIPPDFIWPPGIVPPAASYQIFESNLTKTYTEYQSTVSHGVRPLKATLDLYGPGATDAVKTPTTSAVHSSAPPQFPGSRIVTNASGLLDPPTHGRDYPPLPGTGQTRSLNGWARKPEAQVWALCYSTTTDNYDNPNTFHKQCDKHDNTMVFVKNALGYSFGGYAAGSWGAAECCANSGNTCSHNKLGCLDNTAVDNFLFLLGKPNVDQGHGGQVFRSTGSLACWNCDNVGGYQHDGVTSWPQWGQFDLILGDQSGPPGKFGGCLQGGSFAGYENQVCGGQDTGGVNQAGEWGTAAGNKFGKLILEVWYPVGGK